MKLCLKIAVYLSVLAFFSLGVQAAQHKEKASFVVVIDAGHGGHDPGSIGRISKEKDISLGVSLKLGELIAKNDSSVKVIFTRKTDIYLTLQGRADIANNARADLFVCVHVNSSENHSAFGPETFTLGLAKSSSNLNVAMRENSVIMLEDDYKVKYAGFNPKSVDSYIIFEITQGKYIDQSVAFAQNIQDNFVEIGRKDRGVRQAGFLVLHKTARPSVLVELGFISNPEEERYLNSEKGQCELAQCIYNAIEKFKKEYERKTVKKDGSVSPSSETKKNADTVNTSKPKIEKTPTVSAAENENKTVYKLQIFAVKRKLSAGDPELKGLKADFFEEGGYYKYTYGSADSLEEIKQLKKQISAKFPAAMPIGFKNGVKFSVK